MQGFSPRSLTYVRAFAAARPNRAIVQQAAAQIRGFHNRLLLDRVADPTARNWYIGQVTEHAWSRTILALPYLFDSLGTADPRRGLEVEQSLVDHPQRFLLEVGSGFAFVGRRVHLEFASHDVSLDLRFDHVTLRCSVVIELQAGACEPGSASHMNMYLSAVDDLLRHPEEKPTIGLLLCRAKERLIVEYALRDVPKPIGVTGWGPPSSTRCRRT